VLADAADAWFGILIVLVFNVGDVAGRVACDYPSLCVGRAALLPLSLARGALIPLFVLCVNPRLLTGHAVPYALMLLAGVSNGYVSSLCMMHGPTLPLVREAERPAAGGLMSVSLLAGCTVGSILGVVTCSLIQ
jgi:equilibrative nucleoside transporter 1/2/3